MEYIKFRNLVGVSHTEEEAKTLCEEVSLPTSCVPLLTCNCSCVCVQYEYPGDIDEEGNQTVRPGKLSDPFPAPYPNDEAAKFANNGLQMEPKSPSLTTPSLSLSPSISLCLQELSPQT